MELLKKCELCRKKNLWFLLKQGTLEVKEIGTPIRSDKKMCSKCYKSAKQYFKK